MAKNYIFSTLACDQNYTNWKAGEGGVNIETGSVFVKGGHGVANSKTITTPLGVCTEVTDADMEILEQNPGFQKHKKDGYIIVRAKSADPEKVISDMNLKDPSAPLTDADFKETKIAA